jgi:hypothetical protein
MLNNINFVDTTPFCYFDRLYKRTGYIRKIIIINEQIHYFSNFSTICLKKQLERRKGAVYSNIKTPETPIFLSLKRRPERKNNEIPKVL